LWSADPVYDDRDRMEALLRNRKEIPLFVAVHHQITETTALADYVLPDTTYLERWDVCAMPPAVAAPGVGIRRPVVGGFDPAKGQYFPIFEQSRPMEEILVALALGLRLSGFGEKGLEQGGRLITAFDYYHAFIPAVLQSMQEAGFPVPGQSDDLKNVIDRGGYFPSAKSVPPKKQEPAAARPWQPSPGSMVTDQSVSSRADNEFALITYTLPFHRDPRAGVNPWLLEVLPDNRLLINDGDAHKLGLKSGDAVTLDAGSGSSPVSCKAQPVPGIMPGVVALAVGFGYRQRGVTPQTIDATTPAADKPAGAGLNAGTLLSESRTVKLKKG
jgi:anaerobic selenocysteine-containing dehydrogenase